MGPLPFLVAAWASGLPATQALAVEEPARVPPAKVASTPATPGPPVPPARVAAAAAGPEAAPAAPGGASAQEPPPSAYDLQQQRGDPAPEEEGRGLFAQLTRTVLSLLFVVALIYGIGRLALARLGRRRGPGGPWLRVLERLQLDARHALFVVEVSGKQRLLLGVGGDKGVALLARLDDERASGRESFAEVLATVGTPQPASGSEGQP